MGCSRVACHMPAIHIDCRYAIRGNQLPVAGTQYTTFIYYTQTKQPKSDESAKQRVVKCVVRTRAVRRRAGGRRWRWVVLWPAASASSRRMREQWNSALARQTFFSGFTGVSHFTCDLRWAAGADKLTVNMHAVHNFTVLMSCSLPNF